MAKMTLKELCKELNSPYASYKKNAPYNTAFPITLPWSPCLTPNQAVADKLCFNIVPELLEVKHGSECVQVACLDQKTRVAYIGRTESMRSTIKNIHTSDKFSSAGEIAFRSFAKELERTYIERAHFEYEFPTSTAAQVIFVLKELISVYEAQDKLLDVLKKIAEKKQNS